MHHIQKLNIDMRKIISDIVFRQVLDARKKYRHAQVLTQQGRDAMSLFSGSRRCVCAFRSPYGGLRSQVGRILKGAEMPVTIRAGTGSRVAQPAHDMAGDPMMIAHNRLATS
jgi:hypothetical protein